MATATSSAAPIRIVKAPPTRGAEECNIQVALRCRPRNEEEKSCNSAMVVDCNSQKAQIELKVKQGVRLESKTYTFDKVFGSDSTQVEVYRSVVEPILEEVLQGYNCTVFAYGQTGTGKTHTMEGYRSDAHFASYIDDPGAGIIPRALHHLFEKLEISGNEFSVRVSFLEIYNEELFDLLSTSDDKKLKLFDDTGRSKGSVLIQGLEEVSVHTKDEVYEIMQKGAERRRTGETKMNKCSSRSHSIFIVTIHQKENNINGEEVVKTGKLYMVDLAGSENIGRSGAVKDRAREAGNINQSLLTLGRVINKLVEKSQHIPYRESKLTRILQDSLGGRTKTSIIATISPAAINLEETMSTLDYALRAKSILNRPEINQRLTKKALIKEYNEEIERLKKDLQASREKNGIFISPENYQQMQTQIEGQQAQIDEYTERIEALTTELANIQSIFEETNTQLTNVTAQLTTTTSELKNTSAKLDETTVQLTVTAKDRDQQRHLVHERTKTEANLYKEALAVKSTAQLSSAHVDALHGKLARTSAVEQHNINAANAFEKELARHLEALQGSVQSFSHAQTENASSLMATVAEFVTVSQSNLSVLNEQMTNVTAESTECANGLQSASHSIISSTRDWVATHTSAVHQSSEQQIATATKSHQMFVEAPTTAAIAAIALQQEQLKSIATQMQEWATSVQSAISQFSSTQKQNMEGLQAMVLAHSHEQDTARAAQQRQLNSLVVDQQSSMKAGLASLQAQMAALMSGFESAQNETLNSAVQTIHDSVSSSSEAQSRFVAGVTSAVESTNAACGSTEQQINHFIGASASQSREGLQGVAVAMDECANAMKASVSMSEANVAAVSTAIQTEAAQTIQRGEEYSNDVDRQVGAMIASQSASHIKIQGHVSIAANGIAMLHQSVSAHAASSNTALHAVSEVALQTMNGVENSLRQAAGAVTGFVNETLRRDVPTGETPAKQSYPVPRDFSRTRPHDVLLREFDMAAMDQGSNKSEAESKENENGNGNAATTSPPPPVVCAPVEQPVLEVRSKLPTRKQLSTVNGEIA